MQLEDLIRFALAEDIGSGDITTKLTVTSNATGRALIISKSDGVISGLIPFREVFRQLDETLSIESHFIDTQSFSCGDVILSVRGTLSAILNGERTALNFLGHLSGIATLTRQFVNEVRSTKAVILDTRKTTPLLRALEKQAVVHGGGRNHRHGLFDMILVKDNHESSAGGVIAALERIEKGTEYQIPIEVEVQSVKQVESALKFRIDRILLDNFNLTMLKEAVAITNGKVPLEASGNINLQNVRAIAETGVDYISIGALTHSVPCMDFSMKIDNG